MIKAEITILVPVFNEQESLPRFKEVMDEYLEVTPKTSQVLFINDGSTDNSLDLIKIFTSGDDRYAYISLARNGGLSTAIKAGFDYVTTDLVAYIDSDLQTTPLDFIKYFPLIENHALVNGIRANRHDSSIKKLSSKVANSFRRSTINDGITDTCCPLKLLNTGYAKKIPFFKGMHRFIPALVQLEGGKVAQLKVQHFERYAGTAKYNLLNRLTGPFLDTMAFAWMRKRKIRYEIAESSTVEKVTCGIDQ